MDTDAVRNMGMTLEFSRSCGNIMKFLTTVFPNIQFTVSTHSPFVLNSLENAVIYDLENHLPAEKGLADIPYDGIADGCFRVDTMSKFLKEKFDRYRTLVKKDRLSDEDRKEQTL